MSLSSSLSVWQTKAFLFYSPREQCSVFYLWPIPFKSPAIPSLDWRTIKPSCLAITSTPTNSSRSAHCIHIHTEINTYSDQYTTTFDRPVEDWGLRSLFGGGCWGNITNSTKMIVNELNFLPLKWQVKTQLIFWIQKLSQVTNKE